MNLDNRTQVNLDGVTDELQRLVSARVGVVVWDIGDISAFGASIVLGLAARSAYLRVHAWLVDFDTIDDSQYEELLQKSHIGYVCCCVCFLVALLLLAFTWGNDVTHSSGAWPTSRLVGAARLRVQWEGAAASIWRSHSCANLRSTFSVCRDNANMSRKKTETGTRSEIFDEEHFCICVRMGSLCGNTSAYLGRKNRELMLLNANETTRRNEITHLYVDVMYVRMYVCMYVCMMIQHLK